MIIYETFFARIYCIIISVLQVIMLLLQLRSYFRISRTTTYKVVDMYIQ